MATWGVGISRVSVSVSLVVVVADTFIQAPVAVKMPLVVGTYGVSDVAQSECGFTWSGAAATVNVRSLNNVL